jgi:FkbM family methyltransferase
MSSIAADKRRVPAVIRARLRSPAQLQVQAPLARAVLSLGRERHSHRLRRKTVRALFSLVHRRLGVPARAIMAATNGRSFAVDCADSAFLEFAARTRGDGGFEPEVTALLGHLAPQMRVFYDVGANWGYYPLLLGTDPRFTGEIHAFEIAPRTAAGLRRLAAAAGITDKVRVHAHGLSQTDGEARLSRERHSYLARIVAADYRGRTERVAVHRLDGLELSPPDVIKLDVEGHEAAVLSGAQDLLRRCRPIIVFESWFDAARPQSSLPPLQLLLQSGYELFRPIWRPGGSAVEGDLELKPISPGDRAAIPVALNLLAVHPGAAGRFF